MYYNGIVAGNHDNSTHLLRRNIMADTKTTITITAEQANQVRSFADGLVKTDLAFESGIRACAEGIARILGTKPTLAQWDMVAKEFQLEYKAKRGCVEKTAQDRWYVVVDSMAKEFALEKPKAQTTDAKKKQQQRAKADKAVAAAKAQCVKPADAFQKAEELLKEGKVNEAKAFQAAAIELGKAAAEDAQKQAQKKISEAKEALRKEIVNCADLPTLMAALEILRKGKEPAPVAAKKDKAPRKASVLAEAKAVAKLDKVLTGMEKQMAEKQ
jgi:hypothetical protein